jgi:hypothetical protein
MTYPGQQIASCIHVYSMDNLNFISDSEIMLRIKLTSQCSIENNTHGR